MSIDDVTNKSIGLSYPDAPVTYASHYGEYHGTDQAYFENWFEQNRQNLETLLGPDRDKPIIDVGCGFGLLVYSLLRLGCRDVRGVDVDEGQIAVARSRGLPCDQVEPTAQADYFRERGRQVGVIFLFDVLEHVPVGGQVEFLQTLRSSLAQGGRIILQVPNASSPIAGHMRYIDPTHTSSFTVDSLKFTLRSAGFVSIDVGEAYDEMSAPAGLAQPMRLLRKSCGRLLRTIWRLIYLSEFGRPGMSVPLSRNLVAVARVE
jgi:SAM-dependent methyltransferase